MTQDDVVLAKVREICLGLPDTKETLTWGQPHFRVGEKIFAGYGEERGKPVIGFKLAMTHAEAVIRDPRFWRAPYVGHKGWVSMDASAVEDWDDVRSLILESYRLIAPKRTLAKLDGGAASAPAPAKKTTRTTRKPAARKTATTETAARKPAAKETVAKKPAARKPARSTSG